MHWNELLIASDESLVMDFLSMSLWRYVIDLILSIKLFFRKDNLPK